VRGYSATCVGTPLQHTKRKSAGWLTRVSWLADLSCPSWARTRTLLIQRGRCDLSNSGSFPTFTRVRVTRCRNLPAFMPDFAVLYSLRCRSLLVSHLLRWTQASHTHASFLPGGARTPDRRGRLRAALLGVNNLSYWIQHCLTPPPSEMNRPQTSAIREDRIHQ
jgi:hypothetical protein